MMINAFWRFVSICKTWIDAYKKCKNETNMPLWWVNRNHSDMLSQCSIYKSRRKINTKYNDFFWRFCYLYADILCKLLNIHMTVGKRQEILAFIHVEYPKVLNLLNVIAKLILILSRMTSTFSSSQT